MTRNKKSACSRGWNAAVVLIVAIAGQPAQAEPAVTSPQTASPQTAPDHSVRRLVLALGSGRLAHRDAAERALVALGPQVLPALMAAGTDTVGEAAFRLQGIRRLLEEQAAAVAVEGGQVAVSVSGAEAIGGGPAGSAAAATGARIRLRIDWADGPAPLVVKLPLRSIVAEGPNGEVLPPAQRAAVIEAVVPRDRHWLELPISLTQPSPPLGSLASLRGTVSVWVTGMEHAFEFTGVDGRQPLPGQPRTVQLGRARVTLEDVAVRQDRLLVTASIAYDEPTEALESHHNWLTERPLELLAADGTAAATIAQTVQQRSTRGLTVMAEFARPAGTLGSSLRLRWRLPIAIHEVPVDFAIRTIPLPLR